MGAAGDLLKSCSVLTDGRAVRLIAVSDRPWPFGSTGSIRGGTPDDRRWNEISQPDGCTMARWDLVNRFSHQGVKHVTSRVDLPGDRTAIR